MAKSKVKVTKPKMPKVRVQQSEKEKRVQELVAKAIESGRFAIVVSWIDDSRVQHRFESERFPLGDYAKMVQFLRVQTDVNDDVGSEHDETETD